MMRALYTAATGMRAEQTNVDTIANNLSNVNTTGFKGQRTEFKSLLYQTIQTRSTSGNGDAKPVGAQVVLGARDDLAVHGMDLAVRDGDLDGLRTGLLDDNALADLARAADIGFRTH